VRLRRKYYSAGSTVVAVRTIQNGTDTLVWILSDHLGSTSMTASADGTKNSEIRYSAFGEIRWKDGVTPTNFRYTGQLAQEVIGLDYYVARWYDADLGRFVQADTVIPNAGSAKGFDRYAYVDNNPVLSNDPTGHCGWYNSCGPKHEPISPGPGDGGGGGGGSLAPVTPIATLQLPLLSLVGPL
jgi:RHS repeat-associated protein